VKARSQHTPCLYIYSYNPFSNLYISKTDQVLMISCGHGLTKALPGGGIVYMLGLAAICVIGHVCIKCIK
jgi:hypothetical protein